MEPTNDTPEPVRTPRAERHRLYMQAYNKKYIRKNPPADSLESIAYQSAYKLAKDTADRKAANGGSLKRVNGVLTTKSSIAFKEYIKRHNRKPFIAYIDADLKDEFTKRCKENGLSSARVLEEILTAHLAKG
jgi:hypothetical protein